MGARGTAFASDFDGTLCESDWETRTQTIKPADVEAVRRYQREGGLFGICTGRAFDSAAEPLEGIIEPDFYIVTTGAQIYLKDQGFILDAEIDREVARSIAEHFYDREGARLVVVSGTEFLTVGASRYSMREVASIDEVEGPITGVSLEFNGDIEAAARAQVEVERVFGDSVSAFQNLSSVDIVRAGCSKGTGTKRVKEVFGCPFSSSSQGSRRGAGGRRRRGRQRGRGPGALLRLAGSLGKAKIIAEPVVFMGCLRFRCR